MGSGLDAVMAKLAEVEREIMAPDGLKGWGENVTDEPPSPIGVFPCLVNMEEASVPESKAGSSERLWRHRIGVHLLFGTADEKYSVRARRQWIELITDALDDDAALGDTAIGCEVVEVNYDPFEWAGGEYISANFELEVLTEL